MRVSLRSSLALWGCATIAFALIHCVGSDPTAPQSSDGDSGSTDGNTTGDGNVNTDGGGNDSGSSCIPPTGLAPGAIDLSYAGTLTASGEFAPTSAAIDSQDRVVLVGSGNCLQPALTAMRFLSTGAVDNSFGTSGTACIQLARSGNGNASDVTIAPNEDILIAGSGPANSGSGAVVAQLLDNGASDKNFVGTGEDAGAAIDFLEHPSTGVGIAAQGNQPVLALNAAGATGVVERFMTTGAVDGTFAKPTIANTTLSGIEVDGTTVATVGVSGTSIHLWRSDLSGNPLDDGGIFAANLGTISTSVILRDDGALVAGGSPSGALKIGLFDDSGLVSSFGSGGVATAPNLGLLPTRLKKPMAVQCDDKIVVLGGTTTGDGGTAQISLGRLNANGSLDTSFGTGGTVTATSTAIPIAVLATSKGQLIVVSWIQTSVSYFYQLTRFSQ